VAEPVDDAVAVPVVGVLERVFFLRRPDAAEVELDGQGGLPGDLAVLVRRRRPEEASGDALRVGGLWRGVQGRRGRAAGGGGITTGGEENGNGNDWNKCAVTPDQRSPRPKEPIG
jgi:hypothetical protein